MKEIAAFIAFGLLAPAGAFSQYRYYMPDPKNPENIRVVDKGSQSGPFTWVGNVSIESRRLNEAAGWKGGKIPSEDEIRTIATRVSDFYRREGFKLVDIRPVQLGGPWTFYIDEGLLQEILVYGGGWWDTYTLRNTLLSNDTFNVLLLEPQLQVWLESHPSFGVRYELEEKGGNREAFWNILSKKGAFVGDLRVRTQLQRHSSHRLHIYLDPKGDIRRFGFGLGYSSAFGVELEGRYTHESLFTNDDRFLGGARIGFDRRSSIDPAKSGDNIFYSNSEVTARWYTPPLSGDWLRLFVDTRVTNTIDQRPDLPLEKFRSLEESATLNVNFELRDHKSIFVKVGQQLTQIFSPEIVPTDPYTVTDDFANALVVGAGFDILIGKPKSNFRLNDLVRGSFDLEWRGGSSFVRRTEIWYQKVWSRREADYRLYSRGMWTWGDAQFFDEESITRLGMHSSFDRKIYIQRGLNVTGEFRYNIWGNDFQVGLFNDVALYGTIDHASGNQDLSFADSVGPVIYVYFFDAFQLSFNFATGFTNSGDRSYEANIGFDKVF